MPTIERSSRFKAAYNRLPPDIRKKVKKALGLLAENPRHPSLRSKRLEGVENIYSARVDQNYRLTYERLPGDVLRLRAVGRHDETLQRP